ncbi:MAG: MFS transporter [Thermoplasmata archaeon]
MDRREKTLVAYATVAHSLNHAYILLIPLFLVLWIQEFDTSIYVMGVVVAVAYAFFGGGSVPFGFLSDRIGARALLMVYLAGVVISLLLLSLARSITHLLLALSMLGLFSSIHHPTAISMISKEVEDQGRGLGYHGMGGSLGIAMGPLTASLLLLSIDWRTVLLLFSIPALLLLSALAIKGPVELSSRRPVALAEISKSFLDRGFTLVLLVYIFAGIAYWGALTYLPLYLDALTLPSLSLGQSTMGPGSYLFAALLMAGAAGQVAGGALANRSRVEVLLAVSSGAVALLFILMALPWSLMVAGVAVVFGFLLFMLEPLQNVLVSVRTPGNVRGLAFGLVFLSVFGVGALGAVLGGYLFAGLGLRSFFPLLSAFMVASGVASLLLLRVHPARGGQPTISSNRVE